MNEVAKLGTGADHYRAYVGPPDRYDFMSATQFSLLFANGLRDHHRVLDFGCGSLRLGRLLIPYLQEGRYFGIEPNAWLIHDAIESELGWDIIRLKKPVFSHRDDYDCTSLQSSFHFIMAQSSVGSNYRAACRGRSRAEFSAKLGIALEEADESQYWLELIADMKLLPRDAVSPVLDEAGEIVAMLVASSEDCQTTLACATHRCPVASGTYADSVGGCTSTGGGS